MLLASFHELTEQDYGVFLFKCVHEFAGLFVVFAVKIAVRFCQIIKLVTVFFVPGYLFICILD